MTAPQPQRLREAADAIEEINARDGLRLDTPISPNWLRMEADGMEVKL